MQYLLTAEEYKELVEAKKLAEAAVKDRLQKVCTLAADSVPVKAFSNSPRPWGCILSKKTDSYCDYCPVQDECPHPHKKWSK